MKHSKILLWFDSPQVKRYIKSSTKKHCIRVFSQVAEQLKTWALGEGEESKYRQFLRAK